MKECKQQVNDMTKYLLSRNYKIRWIIGNVACYEYKNAKGNYTCAKTISTDEYRRLLLL